MPRKAHAPTHRTLPVRLWPENDAQLEQIKVALRRTFAGKRICDADAVRSALATAASIAGRPPAK